MLKLLTGVLCLSAGLVFLLLTGLAALSVEVFGHRLGTWWIFGATTIVAIAAGFIVLWPRR